MPFSMNIMVKVSIIHWVGGNWKYYENDTGNPARGPVVTAFDGVPGMPDTPRRSSSERASYQSNTERLLHCGWWFVFWGLNHTCMEKKVVPAPLKKQVLLENHEAVFAGHFLPKKLIQRVSQYYYWLQMKADIIEVHTYVNHVQLVYQHSCRRDILGPC